MLELEYKVLLYKAVIKPIWTYEIQLWVMSSTRISYTELLERAHFRICVQLQGPWFVKNNQLHRDLQIPTVLEMH